MFGANSAGVSNLFVSGEFLEVCNVISMILFDVLECRIEISNESEVLQAFRLLFYQFLLKAGVGVEK